ncbi:MAG: hypothetical protein HXX14_06095 [Bacteroidetes bacterium]|nr:hypothetical protein [Bacteroidota bacterium]
MKLFRFLLIPIIIIGLFSSCKKKYVLIKSYREPSTYSSGYVTKIEKDSIFALNDLDAYSEACNDFISTKLTYREMKTNKILDTFILYNSKLENIKLKLRKKTVDSIENDWNRIEKLNSNSK